MAATVHHHHHHHHSESTPLINASRAAALAEQRRRRENSTCRRFFLIAVSCIALWGLFSFFFQAFFVWPYHYHRSHSGRHSATDRDSGRGTLTFEQLQAILLDTPDADKAREWSRYYTAGAHLAGKNFSQAEWTRQKWESWGVPASIATYDVFINYPVDHSLSLLEKAKGHSSSWDVSFRASLTEDVLDEDPTSGSPDSIPTFHGYSASGNVTGQFVYVNYGTYADYEDLVGAGIDLTGKIAIAKYGGIFRGLKIKRAQELGMVGVLIYSDPGDDGERTEQNGYAAYPDGPARQPSSVQRGSVQFLSTRPGDPTTPGYPSKPDSPRAPPGDAIPSIPSLPISYADALPLLRALNGHGPKASDFGSPWTRNLGLAHKGVEYHVGPSPAHLAINLHNEQEYVTTPQWDVIGIVNGTVPNEVIVVGNHRDAWIVGGAGDPNSGSAVLNEVVRGVGVALAAGWQPHRTIVFASWDGEEYGLIGSTEWVEEYLPWIDDANVAYVNVDVGAAGPIFQASAAPLLNQVLRDAATLVPSANQSVAGQTVADVWDGHISTMGSGSDFTAFQDYAGVPCIDMGFKAGPVSPVYHYHSNYDSFWWMDTYGDPGFRYHRSMAQLLGVLLAELVDSLVIPFQAAEYVDALGSYLDQVESKLRRYDSGGDDGDHGHEDYASIESMDDETLFLERGRVGGGGDDMARGNADAFWTSLKDMRLSLARFRIVAGELDEQAERAREALDRGLPWWNVVGKIRLGVTVLVVNYKYKGLERHFLFEGGLDGRSWFKHVVFAPGLWTGYAGAVYPGLMESIDAKDYSNGLKWSGIINKCIRRATKSLQ
ncbi:Transferrin receptor-like, dimerization domain protein [Cordyceps fumosorosea ARSEF 2679]|uniref:Transferrin receptor-like, dimerization domain protein n=1 Tax=Cordyceps fumosorosea (strain ARSEF 2679) TaxID=1081104 RepID=A0A167MJW6_CORFA|nr:Transferrin receptor-like, dimerization domain protein [Cordyceps fumosorosea ARSEF 2679]OAA54446.1 Transferrin receptor-like, dimerization domain protein [Cordyceps fumosorosea ARSEF 2679]